MRAGIAALLFAAAPVAAQFHPQDLSPDFYVESVANFAHPCDPADCVATDDPYWGCTGSGTASFTDPVSSFVTVNGTTRNLDCVALDNPDDCCTGLDTGTCAFEETDTNREGLGNTFCGPSGSTCVNLWRSQDCYKSANSYLTTTGETNVGHGWEQDDLEQPLYIANCINSHPCVKGGPEWLEPSPYTAGDVTQDRVLEFEPGDRTGDTDTGPDDISVCNGVMYLAQLVGVIAQSDTEHYLAWGRSRYDATADSLNVTANCCGGDVTDTGIGLALDEWHLIEYQRGTDGVVSVWLDEVDVTASSPLDTDSWSNPEQFAIALQHLCKGKDCDVAGQEQFDGYVAAVFYLCDDLVTTANQTSLRNYWSTTFAWEGAATPNAAASSATATGVTLSGVTW